MRWSSSFPTIIAFAQQCRTRLPRRPVPGFLTGVPFRRITSLCLRSGPQSGSPLDQAHPLRGGRDFYARACPTAGHPTAKSGITTQLSGLLLRRDLHPLGECCYGLQPRSASSTPRPPSWSAGRRPTLWLPWGRATWAARGQGLGPCWANGRRATLRLSGHRATWPAPGAGPENMLGPLGFCRVNGLLRRQRIAVDHL